ncbi:MAG: hypothetical protein HY236_01245 [Acidobacteria bacterium]|nr:hypothetical protein [Acidobacteriota bacterium]
MKLYSYVVDHDTGRALNPYFGVCTLRGCKFRCSPGKPRNVEELARVGDWVIGTGGANLQKSAGHGKLIYAMRVDEKLTREEYYADPRFAKKRLENSPQGNNKRPVNNFERYEQFALISRHFYYFGANAIDIPEKFLKLGLEKKGPGFRCDFRDIGGFVKWIEAHKTGKHGEPRMKPMDKSKGSKGCKSSC